MGVGGQGEKGTGESHEIRRAGPAPHLSCVGVGEGEMSPSCPLLPVAEQVGKLAQRPGPSLAAVVRRAGLA